MKKFYNNCLFYILSVFVYGLSACVKSDYDAPPDTSNVDPKLTVTTTIAHLKDLNNADSVDSAGHITADLTIQGLVVMDDRSGNYYKNIVIQDSTGGIELE